MGPALEELVSQAYDVGGAAFVLDVVADALDGKPGLANVVCALRKLADQSKRAD